MNVYETPEGTQLAQECAFVYVLYPYRKTKDLYIALKRRKIRCTQCSSNIDGTSRGPNVIPRLLAHIRGHDRRKSVTP